MDAKLQEAQRLITEADAGWTEARTSCEGQVREQAEWIATRDKTITQQSGTIESLGTSLASMTAQRDQANARAAELQSQLDEIIGTKYGVSATGGVFNTEYLRQVEQSGARVAYFYGQDPRWSQVASTPDDHDLWMQTKATTKEAYEATLASFPATRKGKVYLHYFNEPEDQIERGEFTLAQWQQRTDWLYEAIAASGKTYVVPSVEIMYWDLQQTNAGTAGPARQIGNYLRPGVKAVGMSAYAEKALKDGHEIAKTSPVTMPEVIGAWSKKVGLPVSVITGWAIGTALLKDPISLANRVTWTKAAAANLEKAGVRHIMWFDISWSNGDYRLSSDPNLLSAWRTMAGRP